MRAVWAGAKKREDIYAAFESIYPVLQEFRKGDVDPTLRPPPVPAQLPPPVRMTGNTLLLLGFQLEMSASSKSRVSSRPVLVLSVLQRGECWSLPLHCPCRPAASQPQRMSLPFPLCSARGPAVCTADDGLADVGPGAAGAGRAAAAAGRAPAAAGRTPAAAAEALGPPQQQLGATPQQLPKQ